MNELFPATTLAAPAALALAPGQAVLAAPAAAGLPGLYCDPAACALPVGTRLAPRSEEHTSELQSQPK